MGACCSSTPKDPNAGPEKQKASEQDAGTYLFLKKVDLFKLLGEEDLLKLAKSGETINFEPGTTIIKQDDDGDAFYVIKKGTADIDVSGSKVATLKIGDFFGELALLRDEPRAATITAAQKCVCLKITRESFKALNLSDKLQFTKRAAVGGGAEAAEIKAPTQKTPQQLQLIEQALRSNQNLSTIITLDDAKIKGITEKMWKQEVKSGEIIVRQGDLSADYFYIVQAGSFAITKTEEQDAKSAKRALSSSLGKVTAGGSFGELALLYFAARAATITATEDSIVWVTARQQFKEVLMRSSEEETKEALKYIEFCDVFAPLKDTEKKDLAGAMHEQAFAKGETVFEQGETGTTFYLLAEGKVSCIVDNKEVRTLQATADQPQFFGERALLENEPRAATIKVISEKAKCLWVDKESFDMLLGSLSEIKKRGKDGSYVVKKSTAKIDAQRFGNIKFDNLKKLGLLGCGGFGAVEMVEDKSNGEVYALKMLSKGYVVKSGMQKSVMMEKNVQLMCDSPFIVKLYETFNGPQSLYLLLELCVGGELYATYNKKGLFGNEKCAKFYVAGTLFAFEHLHARKIIFRDLKPENLLLNEKGQVKLTDMGLAKVCPGKTFTTCGTPDYFAPELIASKGHNHAVDWWTLGILTYELMSGHPPFESASPMQIYAKVQKGINRAAFNKKLKGPCETLVKGLCNAVPAERLPMKKGGTDNIKKAQWFAEFDWNAMENLTMDPPYKPVVKSKKDIANFSANKADMPPQIPYKDPGTGWDKEFATST